MDSIINQEGRNLTAERAKNLPKNINREADSLTVNGGIGDGRNDGRSAYHIQVDDEKESTEE